MRRILVIGVSALALTATASPGWSGEERDLGELEYPCPDNDLTDTALTSEDIRAMTSRSGDGNHNEGPARDAMGDPPASPSPNPESVDRALQGNEMPFPAQDVSDADLEPGGTPYPSGYPESAVHGVGDPGLNGKQDSAGVQVGEKVPADIERYQGPDMWEADGAEDLDADTGPSSVAEKYGPNRSERDRERRLSAERGTAGAWDGPEEGPPFHRGDRRPDRSDTASVEPADRQGGGSVESNARAGREAMDRDALGERRLRLARLALRSAQYAVPEVNFRTYNFEIENNRRVIEIAGTSRESGRRVEVDVRPNGLIESISHTISMDQVPSGIRSLVGEELRGFRAAHVQRSLMPDFDVYYEFAGFSASGRPVAASVRADGSDFSIRYRSQS